LTIENIAVIKKAQLELPAGFVAMTGETGAGKSIVIDAINAVLGERTSRDLIRTGADSARVTALFGDISENVCVLMREFDLPEEEDGSLLLSRSISASGKNNCRVNGTPVTVSVLRQLGVALINIHGQHDNQALLDPTRHVAFIDAMAENEMLRDEYRAAYLKLRELQREQDSLQLDENEKARRLDMLRHQIEELERAEIRPGERDALRERQAVMRNGEKILAALQSAASLLGDETGGVSLVFQAVLELERAGEHLPAALNLTEQLRGAAYELQEGAGELRGMMESILFDPAQADEIESRLDTYYRLSRKYGATEAEMLDFLERAQAEEASITQSDARILELETEIEAQTEITIALARQLSKSRREAGELFAQRVKDELQALDMPNTVLMVETTRVPLRPEGGETAEFLISANVGEVPRPLAKVASGGELSRVMLAIKSTLAAKDDTPTLIFDEIDAGVSGRAAQKIGRKLREVAQGRQVICVTHLAQIAALADCHLRIRKDTQEGQTQTQIEQLDFEGRKRELARIMGGEEITPAQLAAAEEMLRSTT